MRVQLSQNTKHKHGKEFRYNQQPTYTTLHSCRFWILKVANFRACLVILLLSRRRRIWRIPPKLVGGVCVRSFHFHNFLSKWRPKGTSADMNILSNVVTPLPRKHGDEAVEKSGHEWVAKRAIRECFKALNKPLHQTQFAGTTTRTGWSHVNSANGRELIKT